MKREEKQGLFVLLLALSLIFGSGIFIYCVWRNPNIAVAAGMLWTVGAVVFWTINALTLRFAPGRIVRKRMDKAIQGKWKSYLSSYNGSGQLLEEYNKAQEENEDEEDEDEDGSIFPSEVSLTKREGMRTLVLPVKRSSIQRLKLKEGGQVLLILSGLMQSVFLVGSLDRIEKGPEVCSVYVTLWKGLICDQQRELLL